MHHTERTIARLIGDMPDWAIGAGSLIAAILVALIVHKVAVGIARRASTRTSTKVDDIFVARLRQPMRWVLVAFAVAAVQPTLDLTSEGERVWQRLAGLVFPGLFGWTVIAVLGITLDIVVARADISVADNLRARRRRTRASILHRIGLFVILLITFCMMLMSIPAVRSIGVTLIASAGLAGLAVGAAAQPALKNLIAGVQMAFTEPIRLDDVLIVDGEWGRVEEIRLTYVVIKLWDERRLIVPVSQFLEKSFQNWTRETSQLLGSVFWQLDPAADIPRLREAMGRLVEANPRWDKRFWNMQVTDVKADAIEVRGLVTARDAAIAFDLRCDIREGLLAFIRDEMPEAMPRRRLYAEGITPPPSPGPASSPAI